MEDEFDYNEYRITQKEQNEALSEKQAFESEWRKQDWRDKR